MPRSVNDRLAVAASEALLCKCAAGCRLQIFLKCDGLLFIAKRDIGFQPPGAVFRSMNNFACVVLCQSRPQIICNPHVEMFGIVTFEDVDVFHERPVFALRATPRQPSLASPR